MPQTAAARSVVCRNRPWLFGRRQRSCPVGAFGARADDECSTIDQEELPMSEILVGIDGSAGAQDALALAQPLVGPAGASNDPAPLPLDLAGDLALRRAPAASRVEGDPRRGERNRRPLTG